MAGERWINRKVVWEESETRSLYLGLHKFHGLEREAGGAKVGDCVRFFKTQR